MVPLTIVDDPADWKASQWEGREEDYTYRFTSQVRHPPDLPADMLHVGPSAWPGRQTFESCQLAEEVVDLLICKEAHRLHNLRGAIFMLPMTLHHQQLCTAFESGWHIETPALQ